MNPCNGAYLAPITGGTLHDQDQQARLGPTEQHVLNSLDTNKPKIHPTARRVRGEAIAREGGDEQTVEAEGEDLGGAPAGDAAPSAETSSPST